MATPKRRRRAGSLRGLTTASRPGAAADRLDNIKADALKVGLLAATGGLLAGAFFLTKSSITKAVEEAKQNKAQATIAQAFSPSYWAERLRGAFNPSGIDWMRDADTTDVVGVHNVARGMRTQAQLILVASAYKALTKRVMTDDLRTELSPGELQAFWSILGKKPKK